MTELPQNKVPLRRQWLAQRRGLTPYEWQRRSAKVCEQLRQMPWYQAAMVVLTYSAYRQELDLQGLLDTNKVWGYPRCVGQQLHWHQVHPDRDELQVGKFGIREPYADLPPIEPSTVDLLLLPAVGLDRRGYRLGYGGGFYDRLLSDPQWQHCRTIGVCFAEMIVDQLPIDPWDQPLQAICSDAGWTVLTGVERDHGSAGTGKSAL